MKFINLIGVVLLSMSLACNGEDLPRDIPADSLDFPAVEKGRPEDPGKSEEAPGREAKPSQVACVPSLTVNGIQAVTGGVIVRGELPSELSFEVTDCPNMELSEAKRDTVAQRFNFGALDPAGSGEVRVSVRERGPRPTPGFGSERVKLSPKSPVVSEGKIRVATQGERLISIHTAPSRRSTPTNRVDTPVRYTQEVRVRNLGAGIPVDLHISFNPSVGSDAAVVIRERQ